MDEQGRPEPPLAAGEFDTLVGFLDFQRATLEWKCGGLDTAGLIATVGASTMTLAGLLKHLSFVEDYWFTYRLHGRPPAEPWASVDWEVDSDWDWHSAAGDSRDQLWDLWRAAVVRSGACLEEALAGEGLDMVCRTPWPDGRSPSLRWILVHMVEEYARHNGHADLLRGATDGLTGE